MNPSATESPGVISAHESYTTAEFRRRTRLEQYAFNQARKNGLRVLTVGSRKKYILGADWIAFLIKQAEK